MNLQIKGVSKTYSNGTKALNNINLEIGNGMFGLLGPNGAGKSTLIRTIATLQSPDEGAIFFNDKNIFEDPVYLRENLGYLPQQFGVYPRVSAIDLLDYMARIRGLKSTAQRREKIQQVLEVTNLLDDRKKAVSQYSGGMKQRFGIAQLLLADPKLIIVDEPTAGLDPAERHRFLNILREVGSNITIIFSTHIVEDVWELSNDMAIIDRGTLLYRNSPKRGIEELDGRIWKRTIEKEELNRFESEYKVLSNGFNEDNSMFVRVYSDETLADFTPTKADLDDLYFVTIKQYR